MKKNRIAREKETVELMIRLYCRKKEKNTVLCPDCEELLRYAHARLDRCPFGEKKSSCKKCTVHCYKPVMRERMRQTLGRHTSFTKPINTLPIQPYTIMKRAIIIGATSGIGQEVAKNLLREGWQIGIAGRRQPALEDFQRIAPEQIKIQSLDVTQADAAEKLNTLIRKLGGMDLFLLSSGIGFQNP